MRQNIVRQVYMFRVINTNVTSKFESGHQKLNFSLSVSVPIMCCHYEIRRKMCLNVIPILAVKY
jgi:hypothetical protein